MEKLKKRLEKKADENNERKILYETGELRYFWKDAGLPNPFDLVEKFIIEKGLKLYGGQALHEYIKHKDSKGFYSKNEFPDYDVFSPDAWNHAKELSDKLNDMGYSYVEAKPSILNDKHHQTYKVSVDFLPMLDLTQVGCPIEKLNKNKCRTCSYKVKGKCQSVFNKIPAIDLYDKKEMDKVYYDTFNYKTKKGTYKNKFFLSSPEWLKISMYWELTEPLGDTSRLPKVGTRLALFEKYYETKFKELCEPVKKDIKIDKKMTTMLDFVLEHIKERNERIVEFGPYTHNFYVEKSKRVPVLNYQIYTTNMPYDVKLIMDKLKKRFRNTDFRTSERQFYWKQYIDEETRIYVKHNNKFHLLVNFVEHAKCMPYYKSNNVKHASIDLMIFNYRHRKELPDIYKITEGMPYDYECMLKDLLDAYKKYSESKPMKYERYVSRCVGEPVDKRKELMSDRWIDKKKTLKKTKYYVDYPTKGFISKITPIEHSINFLPYKPSESAFKKYYHFTKKGRRETLKNTKKMDALQAL